MTSKSTAHMRVVDHLGRMIARGECGDLLPREDDLVTTLAVSRTVVREATKTLQALGLVVTRPRVGSRIRPMAEWHLLDPMVMGWVCEVPVSPRLIRDILDMRAVIEPAAAAMAAMRANPEERDGIAEALQRMFAATDVQQHMTADFDFHERILAATGNALLIQLAPVLQAVLSRSFKLSVRDAVTARESLEAHRDVADAIIAAEPETARTAMHTLINRARTDIESSGLAIDRPSFIR